MVKFSKTLEFNSVREWAEHYIHYEKLKHLIYEIEQLKAQQFRYARKEARPTADDEERLMTPEPVGDEGVDEGERLQLLADGPKLRAKIRQFLELITAELERVNAFYIKKHGELAVDVQMLDAAISPHYVEAVSAMADGGESMTHPKTPLLSATVDYTKRGELSQKARDLYINLCSLKDFVILNYTGFYKILKKYDKVLGENIRPQLLPVVQAAAFWRRNSDSTLHAEVNSEIERCVAIYASASCDNSFERAAAELGSYLREFVVWERNTVWRDMVGHERRVTAAGVSKRRAVPHAVPMLRVRVPMLGHVTVKKQYVKLAVSLALLALVLAISPLSDPYQSRCLALLLFAAALWASEALPLYVTGILIPMMVVVLGILRHELPPLHEGGPTQRGAQMSGPVAAKFIFSEMFTSVIMLMLGGFSIAAALSKYDIAKRMATTMLAHAGTNSSVILLTIMFVATFMSMWISNVAAPVLCFSVIQPLLRTLEPGNLFSRSLVLGIALASNIGGMVTPIASPQNTYAMGLLNPTVSWPTFLAFTLPLATLSNLLGWALLLVIYRPYRDTPRVQPIRSQHEPMTRKQYFIILITLITIGLWCAESALKSVFGTAGVIAIVPIVAFFGSGILDKDDFNSFLWTVAILAMGGTALGSAVKNSCLLTTIASTIADLLAGQSLWIVLTTFCTLTLVAATFISHTVSAMIILPIVQVVGNQLPGEDHSNLLVLGTTILCSGAMGLSVSGFPNIFAVSIEDQTGQPYINSNDFLKAGIPTSLVVLLLTVSIGYGLLLALGM